MNLVPRSYGSKDHQISTVDLLWAWKKASEKSRMMWFVKGDRCGVLAPRYCTLWDSFVMALEHYRPNHQKRMHYELLECVGAKVVCHVRQTDRTIYSATSTHPQRVRVEFLTPTHSTTYLPSPYSPSTSARNPSP